MHFHNCMWLVRIYTYIWFTLYRMV